MTITHHPHGHRRQGPIPKVRPAVSLLHRDPPMTPMQFFGRRRTVFALTVVLVTGLAALAAYDGGSVLLHIDEPVARWVADHRTPWLTTTFNTLSHFGDNVVIFSLAVILAAWTWPRCRYLAVALLFAALLRPIIEFGLKGVIGRVRPDIEPLGTFEGPSHPSGHPMAAASLWGLVPAVIALHVRSRVLWWAAVTMSATIIVAVAASRVYKGAHYLTDVLAALAWAGLYLTAVQGVFDRFHADRDCHHSQHEMQAGLAEHH
jgi:membrane-associated phospholipid phosphatase